MVAECNSGLVQSLYARICEYEPVPQVPEELVDDVVAFHAIRASISIPMVFRPVRSEGRILVDGGLLNPLPLRHAIHTPGSLLVAVDVNSPKDNGKPVRMNPYKLLSESSRLMMQQITRNDLQRCPPDLLIELSARDYDMMEFHHALRIIQSGAEAARRAIEAREAGLTKET